jgi:hypothetical protein
MSHSSGRCFLKGLDGMSVIGRLGTACASGFAAVAVALLVGSAAAGADVLVSAIEPTTLACGKSVKVGVWYQSSTGGPRSARITIKASRGTVVWRRNVAATSRWRYWRYKPSCGGRYVVVYTTARGTARFPFRVKPAPGGPTISIGGPAIAIGSFGDTLNVHDFTGNDLAVGVASPQDPAAPVDQSDQAPSGSRLVAVSEDLLDAGPGTVSGNANSDTQVVGTDGEVYTPTLNGVQGCTNFDNGAYTLGAGQSESGCVVFAIPTGVDVAHVEFTLTQDSVDLGEWFP